ncbi:glycerophosphodiester phosphodiesterase [Dysgonomonas sp. Marseille-P4361]|uniref:glycerophosphodiester phosphodiesterase n=1 Tax=Dysgonomonas sp. Marseille-P4361 TaxID=2161820 RepID=UPI000D550213|nr:glycerophosphodiester phosphodiesterase [Dysgonomonas sp. Marseille-P4361]
MKRLILIACFSVIVFTMNAQIQEIRVFSHRGGRMEHDENTLSAFQASYDAGYRGFETDIRMTKDGELVITHDSRLERTTNGVGVLEEKNMSEIEAMRTKQNNKILSLNELLSWLDGKSGLYVEFELKTNPEDLYPEERLHEFCDKLYKSVMAIKPADAVFVFTSSDYRGLRYLQQKYPGVDLLMITSEPCNEKTIAMCKALGIKRIGAKMEGTSRQSVELAHKQGLIVSLWPGLSTADFMLGAYLGADFMCTDIPIELKKFITDHTPWLNVKY